MGSDRKYVNEVRKVLDWMDKRRAVSFNVKEGLVGGAAYDAHKTAITDETMQDAMDADAVLFGAVGGPQYDNLGWDVRPEAGLLRLRKEMDLFANLRPAVTFDALLDASTLKTEVIQGLDIMIVRELTAGVYFGEPRGMQTLPDGTERCIDTQSYTKAEVERVTEVAFDLARKRNNKLHSVEKANVMKTGVFWRQTVTDLHKSGNYDDIELQPHVCRQLRHAAGPQPETVRRNRHRQPVWGYVERRCRHADRIAGHAAFRFPWRGRRIRPPEGAVRAGPRQCTGHCRPGNGQPAGHAAVLRDDPAILF